jgi:ABC-type antimicrobial peptide transport system permease subunit
MMKNKLFIFINVLGLAIGIGCCIVAFFNWEFDVTFDDHHSNRHQIYRVSSIREFEGRSTLYGFAPIPMGATIRQNIPDIEKLARLSWSNSNLKVADNLFPSRLNYVDPDFFSLFTFEFINGQPGELVNKLKIIISDELAIRLFGTTDVVGKQITQVLGAELTELEVGGVFRKQPSNSSFMADGYLHYDRFFDDTKEKDDDWRLRNSLFVMIPDESRVASVYKQLQVYRENNNKVRADFQISEYRLDPFVGMAQRDATYDTWSQTKEGNPRAAVAAPTFMAGMILLIACFNMTNTAISMSSRRLKEIGVRKVMGGKRAQLIAQFMSETAFVCFLALLAGLFLGEALLSSWNSLWPEMELRSHYVDNSGFLLFLIGVLTFTALVAGSYPAFYISGFEPVSILKGRLKFGGTNYFTRVLLSLQYAISLIAIIFAVAFYDNSNYQRDFDIGFDTDAIIVAYVNGEQEYEAYRNALQNNKDILAIAGSQHSVLSSGFNDPIRYESKEMEVDIINVGDDHLSTMGFDLLEGRDFKKDSETDRRESIIISERLAHDFGWKQPLGKEVIWRDTVKLYVIGVVKNVYTNGLWKEMEPLMMRYAAENYSQVIVKAPIDKLTDVNEFMEEQWKQVFPNRLYNGRYLTDKQAEAMHVNNNIVTMFVFLGVVALVLSATGLFTLVSLNIIKKMKEIGVRKVLGASIANISRIINTEFAIILFVSAIIGSVLSHFAVDAFMGSIWRYYQSTTVITLILSVLVMFAISGAAIGYKVFAAASMNPVSTLRDE